MSDSFYKGKQQVQRAIKQMLKEASKNYVEIPLDFIQAQAEVQFGRGLMAKKYVRQLATTGQVVIVEKEGQEFASWNYEKENQPKKEENESDEIKESDDDGFGQQDISREE